MRNLKRALSLTLASVMLLGMMVVGSSAAAGYDDVKETDNVEAIEVLQAIGVMVGDERGFGPDRPVNRAEMAVVMSLLLNLDYNYYVSSCPFNDVYDWARGPVGACYANKIVSGRGEGVYDPGSTVTAVEAASMLMRALGYFQYSNDYEGGFELATVRQGSRIGIFNGVGSSATEAMTRNQVAQMVLNALQTGMAEPDGNTINLTTPDGSVLTGKVNYVNVTSAKTFAHAISWTQATSVGSTNDGWIVELGEQLYDGKLELRDNTLDVFGRPARTWIYDGTEIGTYAKRELMVASYTTGVSGRTLYEKLTQATIRDYDLDTYTDGSDVQNGVVKGNLVRSNSKDLEDTGRGVLTEVYVDNDLEKITIVSINTFLAQANSDYNETSETVSLSVYYGLDSVVTTLVDKEDVAKAADIKKDDWVLINWADESAQPTNKVVQIISEPEIMTDQTVTAFSRNENEDSGNYDTAGDRVTEITTGGTTYKNNANAWYKKATLYDYNADKLVNKTYTLYMDQYGNFIGAELYSGKDQYVFITGYDRPTSNLSVSTANAAAIFPDGRMEVISVNVKDTNDNIRASWRDANGNLYTPDSGNDGEWQAGDDVHYRYNVWAAHGNDGEPKEEMWYTYTVKNDVYTLTPAKGFTKQTNDTAAEESINCSNVRLTEVGTGHFGTGRSYGEDASVYITVRTGNVDTIMIDDNEYNPSLAITEVNGLYTGVQNVNLTYTPGCWVHSVYDPDDNNMIIAAVILGEAEGIVDNYAYIRKGAYNERYDAESDTHYWKIDVILGGELKTMEVKSRFTNTIRNLVPGAVQELVLDADGYVTKVNPATKVYDAPDWNATTHGSVDVLKGFDIYDIDSDDTNVKVGTTANGDNYVNPVYQGHTLYINSGSEHDAGLEFVSDAKAVVYQWRNNDDDYYVYNDVKTAVDNLADASTSVPGKQFDGRIVAVLNSDGVAEWVLFIDRTPINSTDPNFGGNTTPGQLPAISEMPVTTSGMTLSTSIGRYANGKLYIQFNGLTAGVTDLTISGVTVTETPSGRTHYLDPIAITKPAADTFYVWSGDLALRSETNGLTVTGGTAASGKWTVDRTNLAAGVTVPATVDNAAGTFQVTLNKPAGATEWSYTWTTNTSVTGASNAGGAVSSGSAVTGQTADSVTLTLTKAAGQPAPNIAIAATKYALNVSGLNNTRTGILTATETTTLGANGVATSGGAQTYTVEAVLANAAAADDKIKVTYKLDGGSEQVATSSAASAGDRALTADISIPQATGAVSLEIVSVELTRKVTFTAAVSTVTNMTTAGSITVTGVTSTGTDVVVGTVLNVVITPGTIANNGVTFAVNSGTASAPYTTSSTGTVTMTYTVPATGATAITVAATNVA